ncbi:hypothetical protein D3C78_1271380 [compost metagenome]
MRVFRGKALLTDPVVALRRREHGFWILEELDVVSLHHPGGFPDRDGDPFLAIDRRLQCRGHRGRAAFDELELEAVALDGVAGVAHQAGTGFDADDLAAQLVGIVV